MTSLRLALAAIPAMLLVAACGSATAGTSTAATKVSQPTWGHNFRWQDGLAVQVDAPVPCKPGPTTLAPVPQGRRTVKFTVTFLNNTDKPFDTSGVYLGTKAQFNGRAVEELVDFDGDCGKGIDSTTILPGKTFSGDIAFPVGAQPGEMQIAIDPVLAGRYDTAVFVGQA